MIDRSQDLKDIDNLFSRKPKKDTNSILKKTKEKDKDIQKVNKPKPIIKRDEVGNIIEIELSSSVIKRFVYFTERLEICPKKEYHNTILKDKRVPTTLSMLKGLFFESQCIGGSAGGNITTDLPRKRNGDKTVDQERIEEQVLLFDHIKETSGMIINTKDNKAGKKNVQIKSKVEWVNPIENVPILEGVKIIVKMEADIISPVAFQEYDYETACIDLKLTKDRDSTFGRLGWGNPKSMDHIQATIYSWMLNMPFVYLVFDYKSTDKGYKFIPVNTNREHKDSVKANEAKLRFKEMHQSIRQTAIDILNYDSLGWHTEPSWDRCKNCPIENCKDKQTIQEI